MVFYSIASGSSGNSIYVGSEETKLLIDAGISAKRIEEGLRKIGVSAGELDGILITHEHIDHVRGLRVLLKKYQIPVYGTKETIEAINRASKADSAMECLFHSIEPEQEFSVGLVTVSPFSTSHDAGNPVCYCLCTEGHKIGMATDLGTYDERIIERLSESEILYLEANYDLNMLMAGSYPYQLKRRIAGDKGHLSNDMSSELIIRLLNRQLKHILLAHMSKENNYAELAHETVRQAVAGSWTFSEEMPDIRVAGREIPTEPIFI